METKKMFAEMEYAVRKRVTVRDEFLRTMDYVIPWDRWVDIVRPLVPEAEKDDHRVMLFLRMFLLQKWFGLQDAQLADCIYDSYAMWFFMEVQATDEWLPAPVSYQAFRDALEQKGQYKAFSEEVNSALKRYGREMVQGALVEAVLLQRKEEFIITPPIVEDPLQVETKIKQLKLISTDKPVHSAPEVKSNPLEDENQVLHQLETRLRRLERFKSLAEYDAYEEEYDDDNNVDDRYDEYDQKPRPVTLFTPQRVMLAALLVTVFAASVVVIYDYLQSGTWFRWFAPAVTSMAEDADALVMETPPAASVVPSTVPTLEPTAAPTMAPTQAPTAAPTQVPTQAPTAVPTAVPTQEAPANATTQNVLIPFPVAETGGTPVNQGVPAGETTQSTQTGGPVVLSNQQNGTSHQASSGQAAVQKIDVAIACLKAKKAVLSK